MTMWDDIGTNSNSSVQDDECLVEFSLADNLEPIVVQKLNNNFRFLRDHASEKQVVQITEIINAPDSGILIPPATNATLGGIIVGENLFITNEGVLSAQAGGADFLYFDEVLF